MCILQTRFLHGWFLLNNSNWILRCTCFTEYNLYHWNSCSNFYLQKVNKLFSILHYLIFVLCHFVLCFAFVMQCFVAIRLWRQGQMISFIVWRGQYKVPISSVLISFTGEGGRWFNVPSRKYLWKYLSSEGSDILKTGNLHCLAVERYFKAGMLLCYAWCYKMRAGMFDFSKQGCKE